MPHQDSLIPRPQPSFPTEKHGSGNFYSMSEIGREYGSEHSKKSEHAMLTTYHTVVSSYMYLAEGGFGICVQLV